MSKTVSFDHLRKPMEALTLAAMGINFTLCMEHDVKKEFPKHYNTQGAKDYSFHPRWNQPCQGGEMRKYTSIHGKECDKPESTRPTDLFHPFPKGNPVMVGKKFYKTFPKDDIVIPFLFSLKSPYRKGIGQATLLKDNNSEYAGVVLSNTEKIDPTVMVNLFQFVNQLHGFHHAVLKMIEHGATITEALALVQLGGMNGPQVGLQHTYDYYFAEKFSVQKFFDGEPNQLSNGSYYDRHDYDRVHVQDLFMEPDKNLAFIWSRDMADMANSGTWQWKGDFYKEILPVALDRMQKKYIEQSATLQQSKAA